MKTLKNLSVLILSVALFSVAFFAAGLEPVAAATASVTFHGVIYYAAKFGFISLPGGVFAEYVAGVGTDGSAGVTVLNTERKRGVFMHVSTDPKYRGKPISPSFLRLEATIKQNESRLIFKTFTGDGASVYPTELRLDRNDAFVVDRLGFFLLKQDVANEKTNGVRQTYPNITVFGAAAAADLWSIYESGKLNITINKKRELIDYDLANCLYVPRTQQTGAINYDDKIGAKAGFDKLTPHITLDGSGTNEIVIDFPSFAGWAGHSAVAGTEHRAVLFFRGMLISGGSQNS